MIQKVINRGQVSDQDSQSKDLKYWLSRPAEERVAAVDFLRKQYIGSTERLQRSARVIERT